MFLKQLTVSGFKSFADQVCFEFGPGVTCIVGPNGCGKSNVVDAFRWVLGEQSAKSLRGRQMIDMIFNGSEARRSASVSEIEVVFANPDRALPLDCDEVSISRKLYRSGESEYRLNKEPTRLKDIRELFLDTGIGTEAYSIIEQGKVDLLLRSNPVERRAIFEEAAGISRYKARRREAERKLERTQQNLLRLGDIIEEVERRLRSVKLQAGKARNYQTYETELNELRARYSMAEYHRLTGEMADQEQCVRVETDRGVELRTQIDVAEAEGTTLTTDADRLAESLSATENEHAAVASQVTALEERIASAQRRVSEQAEQVDRGRAREAQHRRRHAELTDEARRLEEQGTALEQEVQRQREIIDRLTRQDQALARNLTQCQAMLEDIKVGIFELVRRTSRLHNEIASLDQHVESLSHQKGRLRNRDEQIARELGELIRTRGSLEARLAELDELIASETRRLEAKKADATRVERMRLELAERLAEAKEKRSGLVSRSQLLHDLEEKMEGVGAAVRRLLEQRSAHPQSPALASVEGMVADVFDVEVEYASVIEAVLGEGDQWLVVRDRARFLSEPAWLEDLPGRLTVVFLDHLPPVINERDFGGQPGFIARAVDLLHFPPHLEHLAHHLFGKTIVVDDLDCALALADGDVEGHRFVTLTGEVVDAHGCVRWGPGTCQAGLISRKSELRGMDERLADVTQRISRLEDQLNRTTAEAGHLAQVQQELRTAIYETHTAKVEANATLQNVNESIRRLSEEQPLIAGEVEALARQIAEATTKSHANREDLDRLAEEKQAREAEVAKYQQRLDEIVAERERSAARVTEARVRDGQLGEKRAAVADALNTVRRTLREVEAGADTAARDVADAEQRIAEAETAILTGQEQLADLQLRGQRLQAEAMQLRQARNLLRLESDTLTIAIKQHRVELDRLEGTLHAHQLELNELRVRREDLEHRVGEELGLDLAALHEQYEPTEEDWAAVEARIAELRQKLERLGNVNLDAITEQNELEERLGFLTGQRGDLDESHRQLVQLIDKLNHESRTRFLEAFTAIRANFQELFRKLFGGGKADVLLEDPEDPLECGIEIVARPPGKSLQSISLMSGGEKSMTALALVMSIFRSRPAPFAVLDEVDAALDEANSVRFNNIVREFLDRSQFIIITHSKRTMSVADHMYGVTMQEPGVSSLVSVRFNPDREEDEAAAGAVA